MPRFVPSEEAIGDLQETHAHIAAVDPGAARRVLEDLRTAIRRLVTISRPQASADERASGTVDHLSPVGHPPAGEPEAFVTVFRIAQEALFNVRQHARATSAHVALGVEEGHLAGTVDDRIGSNEASRDQPGRIAHLGRTMQGMAT